MSRMTNGWMASDGKETSERQQEGQARKQIAGLLQNFSR
jgi:hypothetical protein